MNDLPGTGQKDWFSGDWRGLSRSQWALALLVFALALAQRWHGLERFPRPHDTNDEYHYVWAGLSLLEEGRPTTWSFLWAYAQLGARIGTIQYEGQHFYIVRPGLDHPPLFSLLAGGFARSVGVLHAIYPTNEGGQAPAWNFVLGRVRLLTLILFAFTF